MGNSCRPAGADTSPAGLRSCCDAVHLETGLCCSRLFYFKLPILGLLGASSQTPLQGKAGRAFHLTQKLRPPWVPGPSLCPHRVHHEPYRFPRTDLGCPCRSLPTPSQFCPLAEPHGISSISALGIPTSLFLSFLFPSKLQPHKFLKELPSPQGTFLPVRALPFNPERRREDSLPLHNSLLSTPGRTRGAAW